MDYPHFYKKTLIPLSMIFQKSHHLYIRRGVTLWVYNLQFSYLANMNLRKKNLLHVITKLIKFHFFLSSPWGQVCVSKSKSHPRFIRAFKKQNILTKAKVKNKYYYRLDKFIEPMFEYCIVFFFELSVSKKVFLCGEKEKWASRNKKN